VVVNFGDMTPVVNLGAVAGSATTQHVYARAGTFTVSATATDTGGGSATARTTVVVVSSATLSLSASPNPVAGTAMQFTVGVAPGPGVAIQNVRLAYGDNTQDDLGVVSGTPRVSPHTYAAAGTFTATVSVTIVGGTAPLTTTTNVGVCGLLSTRSPLLRGSSAGSRPGPAAIRLSLPRRAGRRSEHRRARSAGGDSWSINSVVGIDMRSLFSCQSRPCRLRRSGGQRADLLNPVAAGPVSRQLRLSTAGSCSYSVVRRAHRRATETGFFNTTRPHWSPDATAGA
jgi:PKD repeat protein